MYVKELCYFFFWNSVLKVVIYHLCSLEIIGILICNPRYRRTTDSAAISDSKYLLGQSMNDECSLKRKNVLLKQASFELAAPCGINGLLMISVGITDGQVCGALVSHISA